MPNEIVYKYEKFDAQGAATLDIPANATVIRVGEQRDRLCLWVRLDPTAPPVSRRFRMIGTGWSPPTIEPHWPYVGSVMLRGGTFVFHVFEETANAE